MVYSVNFYIPEIPDNPSEQRRGEGLQQQNMDSRVDEPHVMFVEQIKCKQILTELKKIRAF